MTDEKCKYYDIRCPRPDRDCLVCLTRVCMAEKESRGKKIVASR